MKSKISTLLITGWQALSFIVKKIGRILIEIAKSQAVLRAENEFLRTQLSLLISHNIKPRRPTNQQRWWMAFLSRLHNWRESLVIVKPETLIKWHRQGYKLFWRATCQRGRPTIEKLHRELIRKLSRENPDWGQGKIAAHLILFFGVRHSPRTVKKYMPKSNHTPSTRPTKKSQTWNTFIKNHLNDTLACDFFGVTTLGFKTFYVFIIEELETRKILHFNITQNPTALWTQQQFREAIPSDHHYRYLIRDRDSKFSTSVDETLKDMKIEPKKIPARTPQANGYCERLIGTIRRECLDQIIPLNDKHIKRVLREWIDYYNTGRPHSSLGPNIPEPSAQYKIVQLQLDNRLPKNANIRSKPILNGLVHEYWLEAS